LSGVLLGAEGCTQAEIQSFVADTQEINDYFGSGVAINGNTLVVGASRADGDTLTFFETGRLEIWTRASASADFTYSHTTWPENETNGSFYGEMVVYDGSRLLVGQPNLPAPGRIVAYDGTTDASWDANIDGTGALTGTSPRFGYGIGMVGNHVIGGAPTADAAGAGGSARGQCEYWEDVAGTWTHRQTFTTTKTSAGQRWGTGVAMTDDSTAYIYRHGDAAGANLSTVGTVEKWTRSGTTWTYDSEWTIPYGQGSDLLPTMNTDGTNLVMGFGNHDAISNNEGITVILSQTGTILSTIEGDTLETEMGTGVAIDGSQVFIGEERADVGDTNTGSCNVWNWCSS
jgi:hypothetical protein